MSYTLSKSTRVLIGGLLLILLTGQLGFSGTFLIAQTYTHNGRISHQAEQWKETNWYYDQANQWYPYNHHWWYSVGVAQKEMGDWQASVDAMEQGLIRAPYFVLGYVRAATLKYKTKDLIVAKHLINQADALVPRHREINYLQALVLTNNGHLQEATAHLLESRRDAVTPHVSIEALLAYTAIQTGRNDIALEAANRLTQLDPEVPKHWIQKGQIHRNLNQPRPAMYAYETALNIYDKNHASSTTPQPKPTVLPKEPIEAHLALGELYAAQQQYPKSVKAFYAVTAMYSTIPQSKEALDAIALHAKEVSDTDRLTWACVLSAGRRWEEAGILFEGLNLGVKVQVSPVTRYHYALVLRHTGQLEAALAQFRAIRAQAFIPSLALADLLRVAGQPAAARFEYSKILALYKTSLSERQRLEISSIIAQLTPKTL